MDALLAVFAEGFRESQWADQEVGFALGRDVPVVNVLHGTTPHGFVARWQGILARDREMSAIGEDIFSSLSGDSRSKEALGEALAVKFAQSRSYDAAKSGAERLAATAPLSEDAIRIAARGFRNNPECRYAECVREKLVELVEAERLNTPTGRSADATDADQDRRAST